MHNLKRFAGMAAAIAMLSVTTAAQAAPAAQLLSLSKARASAPAKHGSHIHGSTWLVGILALAAVVGGTIALSHKSSPKSP